MESTVPSGGDLSVMMARIIMRVVVFEAERTDCRHLGDVFSGLCPVKMPSLAGQNDDTARRIGFHLVTVERFAESDVEDTRHDRVDAIFRMLVRHQFRAVWYLDPNDVRSGFAGMADQDGKTSSSRERRKRLPRDVFGQNGTEYGLIRLMIAGHGSFPSDISLVLADGEYSQSENGAIRKGLQLQRVIVHFQHPMLNVNIEKAAR
jgi:hypothetical protein